MDAAALKALEQALGYKFTSAGLAVEALTHPSCNGGQNNQRLEFLGDTVLGLVVSTMLFRMFPSEREGDLAKRQAALVRSETLAEYARSRGLQEFLKMSEGEVAGGGRKNPTNLEDMVEALFGAVYLDGGLEAVEDVMLPYWEPLAKTTAAPPKDPKTSLQEWAQGEGWALPQYRLVEKDGPAHAPMFTVEVSVNGTDTVFVSTAATKRVAEREAAKLMLEHLRGEGV